MKKLLGHIGVDAGLVMVGDPCYFIGNEAPIHKKLRTWEEACNEVFCKEGEEEPYIIADGLGIAVGTTYGDGEYPVYLEESEEGKRRLIVDLD